MSATTPISSASSLGAELTVAPSPNLVSAQRQLKVSSVLTIIFGLLFALGSHDATDMLVRRFTDLMFWRLDDGVGQLTDTTHLADAILGGVMCGWAAMTWLLADRLLLKAPKEIKSIILISLCVWFVPDSLGSIASGAWLNAISNIGFFAMFALPLRKI